MNGNRDGLLLDGVIIKGVGGLYSVTTETGVYQCSARGVFRSRKITPLAGDNVVIRVVDQAQRTGSLEEIKERSSELLRPRVANARRAAIVIAVKSPALNYGLLDRQLILAENEGLKAVICVNKTDLDTEGLAEEIKSVYESVGYSVFPISTLNGTGIDELRSKIGDGSLTVFSGASGVGKSSIINAVIDAEQMETGELSEKIDRGKHTTRHTQLLTHEYGYIADSPGFTSLYMDRMDVKRLPQLFREFKPYLDSCRYTDCAHIKETDCGVKAQVGGTINQRRYETYVSIYNEISEAAHRR